MKFLCCGLLFSVGLPAMAVIQDYEPSGTSRRLATMTLDLTQPIGKVDERIYGQFLEHIYRSVDGGLDAELVQNGGLEENGIRLEMPGFVIENGTWEVVDNELRQVSLDVDTHWFFRPKPGEPWPKDYVFSVKAKKLSGSEGFLVIVRAADTNNFLWWNLGGWGNKYSAVEHEQNGLRTILRQTQTPTTIETGRWYNIQIEVKGDRTRFFLDGELLTELSGLGVSGGFVGLGTWNTSAAFADLTLMTLDGEVVARPDLKSISEAQAKGLAAGWLPYQEGEATVSYFIDTLDSFQGRRSQRIEVSNFRRGCHGFMRGGIVVSAGQRYLGHVALKGKGGPVSVRLIVNHKIEDEVMFPKLAEKWQIYPFALTAKSASAEAQLSFGLSGEGTVSFDSVSLRPAEGGKPAQFRGDLLEAIKALKPAFIRWPGGYFAERYRWKEAIGPKEKRISRRDITWGSRDPNLFGTDEFMKLCQAVGAEPLICLNIGQHEPEGESEAYVQEALDWIEYCNGDVTTKWGALRAANGHPEPYQVKYWELGNETWGMGIDRYIQRAKKFIGAIRARYPELTLLVCGAGGHNWLWNQQILDALADGVDVLSLHHYGAGATYADRVADALRYVEFMRLTAMQIKSSRNPKMQIAVTEWNLMSVALDTGLWAAIFLNGCERLGETVRMTCPALFIRNVDAPDWNNALINFGPQGWFPAPNYLAMKLYHDHFAPTRLAAEVRSEVFGESGGQNLPDLDAVATTDGKRLIIKAVNLNPENAVQLTVNIKGGRFAGSGEHHFITGPNPGAENSLAQPNLIEVKRQDLSPSETKLVITLPKHSINVLSLLVGR